MKTTRSVRLPADLIRALEWVRRREGEETSDAIRRLVRKGLEREVAELYTQGKVSLREACEVLTYPLLQTLDLLSDLGVSGNIRMEQAMESWKAMENLG